MKYANSTDSDMHNYTLSLFEKKIKSLCFIKLHCEFFVVTKLQC